MEKLDIVRLLKLANDLLSIEGGNPYRVRAHHRAADAILASSQSISEILRQPPGSVPGVGKETLAMIDTLKNSGMDALLKQMDITIPVESAELLRLPGIGPKTAQKLVQKAGIHSVEELSKALQQGLGKELTGLGQNRLSRLRRTAKAFLSWKENVPIGTAWPLAVQLQDWLRDLPGVADVSVTGWVRRFNVMSPRVELIIASDEPTQLLERLTQLNAQIDTDISNDSSLKTVDVTVDSPAAKVPVRFYVTDRATYPVQLMRTTGDSTHQEIMTRLLRRKGIDWTTDRGPSRAGKTLTIAEEADIYCLAGLPPLPPELREGEGILRDPVRLVKRNDLHGDLHVHSNWSDGALSISEIVHIAEQMGYEYIAITDHSQSLTIAGGLTPALLQAQRAEIEQIQRDTPVKILQGIEVDILADGSLDLPDDTLFSLDVVTASIHSSMHQGKEQMTDRLMRAIEHPAVHIIGHLSGRIVGRRTGYEIDTEKLIAAAAAHGTMFELNANPNRLDISEDVLRKLQSRQMLVPISTDAHGLPEFDYMDYGIRMAHRGWLYREDVLNTLPYEKLLKALDRD